MSNITISLDDEVKNIIEKRAKKNLLSLKEQIEEIIRQSAIRTKTGSNTGSVKIDDKLVGIFSRIKRGSKKKKL